MVSFVLSPDVLADWYAPEPTTGRDRGAVDQFSDTAILALLRLKLMHGTSFSGVVGLVQEHFAMRHIARAVPDESTLCRRAQRLGEHLGRPIRDGIPGMLWVLPPAAVDGTPTGVLIDSTGQSETCPGHWRSGRPHGREEESDLTRRRTWLKVHKALDPVSGQILAVAITPSNIDDGIIGTVLLEELRRAGYHLQLVVGDGAFDTKPFYEAALAAGLTDVRVPPRINAAPWATDGPEATPGATLRNRYWGQMVAATREARHELRKQLLHNIGYHARSLVETSMFCLSRVTTGRCAMRSVFGRVAEMLSAVAVLKSFAALCRPVRYARRWTDLWPEAAAAATP